MKLSDCLKTVYQMAVMPDGHEPTAFDKAALTEFVELYKIVVELENESIVEQEDEDNE